MSGLLCAGDLYLDRFDDSGNSTGLLKIGNATKFAITEAADTKTRISKGLTTYGAALDTVQIKKPTTIDITLDEVNATNLAMSLLGSAATSSQASGTVSTGTPEALGIVFPGTFSTLHFSNVTGSLVIKTTAGTPVTLVADTDYTLVDAVNGLVKWILGTNVTAEGVGVTASYAYGASSSTAVAGGTKPTIKARALLIGKNLATGSPVKVNVVNATLAPKSQVDFLADNFVPLDMAGTLNLPADGSEAYTVNV